MLKKSSLPWSIKQFYSMNEKGKLNFDIAIQRKDNIWDKPRKSLFIHSLIMGYPVPPMYAKFDGEIYYFIDGKQRLMSLFSYLNNEFPLSESIPDIDGEPISGLNYSELPESLQKVLNQTTLTITRFDNISNEEIEEMFFRLNNGVSLKSIESIRVLLGMENMKTVDDLSNHPFFLEKSSISKNRYTIQEAVLHLFMYTKLQNTGFSSKELKSFVEGYKKEPFESDIVETVQTRLDFLNQAFEKKKTFLKKIHLPMIYSLIEVAKEKDIQSDYFGIWVEDYFKKLNKESSYYLASQSGSAKKENVQIRLKEINKAFLESFNVYEKEPLYNQ